MKRPTMLWVASLVAVFAAGVCCGAFFTRLPVRAATTTETEAGKAARENFVQAANKEYTVLTDILKATLDNQQRLEAIEKNTADTVNALGALRARPAAAPARPPVQKLP